jgi:molybdenum cofactor synthesis domain-containing protein
MLLMAGARAAVVTVSDGVTHGTRTDESGDVASTLLSGAGFDVVTREVVPDERDRIEDALRRLAATHALVVTTGGTGFGPRDVTPEATRAAMDREAPGLAELMRAAGLAHTPMAALSRAVAGVVGEALVVNLPGSSRGVTESLEALLPVVPHAVQLLGGATGAHPTGHAEPGSAPAATAGSDARPPGRAVQVEATAVKAIGSPPCRVGSRMTIEPGGTVRGTLGCAEFDAGAVEAATHVAATGVPQTRTLHHDLGDIEVFFEPHVPAAQVVVVSATDVARHLRALLAPLGYEVVTLESRSERLAPSDGPSVAAIGEVALDEGTRVVLTDHDAPDVLPVLRRVLRSPVRFVGVMGSRRHVGHYVDTLRAEGFGDDELGRIRSPLGLDLGGRDPQEIALSIAAGLVADAYERGGGWLDRG